LGISGRRRVTPFGNSREVCEYDQSFCRTPISDPIDANASTGMSSLYNVEPQPTAKVLLQTSSGDILLELFAKQTPLASRNFLQLCVDGYYDGTIFHRVVPGFIIQGGDPTGTGEGGEAIYDGGVFADEFFSRLKFNRRGLLGMANSGKRNDNGSQFFITLGKAEELDGKNTMFGRVAGDTIFNVTKMGETELVEGSERPLYPTKITGTEVLVNPFEDMVRREAKPKAAMSHDAGNERKKTKKKGGKTLLSFADEDGEGPGEPISKRARFNTTLVSAAPGVETSNANTAKSKKPTRTRRESGSIALSPPPRLNTHPETQLPLPDPERPSRSPSGSPRPAQVEKVSSLLERTNAQIAELKASMRRNISSSAPEPKHKKSALEQMIPENAMRGRKRKKGHNDDPVSDREALKMLNAFKAKLDQAPPETRGSASPGREGGSGEHVVNGRGPTRDGNDDDEANLCDLHFIANCQSCQSWENHLAADEAEEDDDGGWMSHTLTFKKDRLGKDLTWKKKNEEELVVIDPREKAREIKEEQRAKRLNQGGPNRAWDRDRDRGRMPERLAGERR
jgi:peptidyl-prolyl cis-trans isomerase SDCCAG10